MKTKPRSRGIILFTAVCWTLTTILWSVTVTIIGFGQYYNWLFLLQIAVLLLSLLNAIINWCRYATFDKESQTNDITGGTDHE